MQQHLCPILCLGTAGTGVDAEDSGIGVVGTPQGERRLASFQLRFDSIGFAFQLGNHLRLIFCERQ